MYEIKKYSYDKAKALGVTIKTSKRKYKKIDVFTLDGKYICSIGDSRYNDFPSYLGIEKELALERRRLYHQRHKKDDVLGSPGWYSLKILW